MPHKIARAAQPAEGISYLVVLGIGAWSVYTKARHSCAATKQAIMDTRRAPPPARTARGSDHTPTGAQPLPRPAQSPATPHVRLAVQVSTGTGLPAGPSGLLGAVEGFSFLTLLAGVLVVAANAAGL